MNKSRRNLSILLAAAILVAGFFTSRYLAIQSAMQTCNSFHITQLEAPHGIQASLLLLRNVPDARPDLINVHGPGLPIWLVSMEGTWAVSGPPAEQSQPEPDPALLHRCEVIVNVLTTHAISAHAN